MDMHLMKPGPEHDVLARFAGDWTSVETMPASPWTPEAQHRTGSLRARMMEGFFLVSDYEQSDAGGVCFRGHGVYSWDPAAAHYVMHWFDSMGGAGGLATGTFDDTVLTYSNTSPTGQHRYRYTLRGASAYDFDMAMSPDGEIWTPLMHATYQRG